MKILISNDDGYQAPGINALADVLSEEHDVYIVAPDRNRSGASNSLTLDRPLTVRNYQANRFYVNGTPTDCMHLALTGLLSIKPDILISGVNDGENLGSDVLYSGTVAAAVAARGMGLPSIAVSLQGKTHFDTAAKLAKRIAEQVITHPLPAGTILNVNVPDIPLSKIQGMDITRLGVREVSKDAIREINPRGKEIYWIGLPGDAQESGPGTDFFSVAASRVSVTPLKFDLTHYEVFESLSTWVEKLL